MALSTEDSTQQKLYGTRCYFSIEYCTVISDARDQKFKNARYTICLLVMKLFCSCRSPIELRLEYDERSFRISQCVEKSVLWIRGTLNIHLSLEINLESEN